jgi:hypothetical protein
MVDNVAITAGSGTDIATDDVAGVHYQRFKLDIGGDGAAAPVVGGQLAAAASIPVVLASDDTLGGVVKAEDAAHVTGDKGIMALGVRNDAGTTFGGTDGDYMPMSFTGGGALRVSTSGAATVTGQAAHDAAASGNPVLNAGYAKAAAPTNVSADGDAVNAWHLLNGAQCVNLTAAGALIAGDATYGLDVDVQRLPGSAHDSAVTSSPILNGGYAKAAAPTNVSADGDAVNAWHLLNGAQCVNITAAGALIGGDAANGLDVDVTRLPALAAGTNNIGDVDVLTIAAGDNNIGNVDIVTMPNVTLAAGTNTNEVVGDAAHDAAIAGNPVRIAGRALTADYTAVVAGDTADLMTDLNGRLVIRPYALPENLVQGVTAAITNTTVAEVLAAGGAGIRNYVTSLTVTNSHATVGTLVEIRDGTTTVIHRGYAAPAGGGYTITFPTPLKGTAATAINAYNITTGSNTYVSASGFKGI